MRIALLKGVSTDCILRQLRRPVPMPGTSVIVAAGGHDYGLLNCSCFDQKTRGR